MKDKLAKIFENQWYLFLVCLFLGPYGIHRLLMRRWRSGLLMLLLAPFGVSLIWAIVDLVRIALGKLTTKPIERHTMGCYATDGKEIFYGVVY